jgi:hypothetical protein
MSSNFLIGPSFLDLIAWNTSAGVDLLGVILPSLAQSRTAGISTATMSGSGLARLYQMARHQWTSRQTSAMILQFPNGEKLGSAAKPCFFCPPHPNQIRISAGRFTNLENLIFNHHTRFSSL